MLPSLEIEYLPLEKLIPYANNPKLHPPEQIAQIAASIKEFGFNDPVALDMDDTIIEGHGRVMAARKIGMEKVPVIRLGHLSSAQKTAYIIAHNKLTINSGFDLDLLKVEFSKLDEMDYDLDLTGFSEIEIKSLDEDQEPKRKSKREKEVNYEPVLEVIVECEDELQQEAVHALLTERGYKCRILTL